MLNGPVIHLQHDFVRNAPFPAWGNGSSARGRDHSEDNPLLVTLPSDESIVSITAPSRMMADSTRSATYAISLSLCEMMMEVTPFSGTSLSRFKMLHGVASLSDGGSVRPEFRS